jgi:hypothetical protein
MISLTSLQLKVGYLLSRRAITPAANGAEDDVPLKSFL